MGLNKFPSIVFVLVVGEGETIVIDVVAVVIVVVEGVVSGGYGDGVDAEFGFRAGFGSDVMVTFGCGG